MRGLTDGGASSVLDRVEVTPGMSPAPAGGGSRRLFALIGRVGIGLTAVVLVAGPRLPGAAGQRSGVMATSFVALVTEALPFLLIGAAISTVARGRGLVSLTRFAGHHPRLAAALAPLTGAVLPLCDCGLVPIARRLRDAGAPSAALNGFVAGAAVWNPIVVVSTLAAFPHDARMVIGRLVVGLLVAMVVSAVVVAPSVVVACPTAHIHGAGHDDTEPQLWWSRLLGEVSALAPTLVVGGLVASALATALPTRVLAAAEQQPLLGALSLMLLAVVLSICSQADAFVVASLPVGVLPRLAFLTLSPVLNLKLAALYGRVFGRRWLLSFVSVVLPSVLVACVLWTSVVPT